MRSLAPTAPKLFKAAVAPAAAMVLVKSLRVQEFIVCKVEYSAILAKMI
jgi:hypothetical protein